MDMSPLYYAFKQDKMYFTHFFAHEAHICILGHSAHFTKSQETEL